jgi:hypothetical protein
MEYRGGSANLRWAWSGGTLDLSKETRQIALSTSIDMQDVTSWTSAQRQYVPTKTDYHVQWSGVAQNNATASQGTLYQSALREGNIGTLYLSPAGTLGGNLLYLGQALCAGVSMSMPYNDVTSISTDWYVLGDNGAGISSGINGVFIVGTGIIGTDPIGV